MSFLHVSICTKVQCINYFLIVLTKYLPRCSKKEERFVWSVELPLLKNNPPWQVGRGDWGVTWLTTFHLSLSRERDESWCSDQGFVLPTCNAMAQLHFPRKSLKDTANIVFMMNINPLNL